VDEDGTISDESLTNVLLEVLRMYPPFLGGRRVAKRETTLDNFAIPKGMPLVYINMGAHMDPTVFSDPHCFRPFRWKHE
jgi:cytochrome P450